MFCIRQHSMNIDSFRCSCAICTKCKNLLKTNMRLLRKAQHVALWEQDVFLHSKRSAALPAAGSPVRSYIFFRPIYIYIFFFEWNSPCCFGPSFHVRSKDVQAENHEFLYPLAGLRDQKQHSIRGNIYFSCCQNFVGTWYYFNCPKNV